MKTRMLWIVKLVAVCFCAVSANADQPVATPVISPDGGDYAAIVNISCATPGVIIRYTTDGSEPTETNGTAYTDGSPILVNEAMTMKAAAWADGYARSSIAQASFASHENLLIDSLDYPNTAALQSVWFITGGDCPVPTSATYNGVQCLDEYLIPYTGSSYGRGICNRYYTGDLSQCTGLTFSMAATNPGHILYGYMNLYTNGNTNDRYSIMELYPTTSWQTFTIPKSAWAATGSPNMAAPWLLEYGFFTYPNTGDTHVYIANIIANGATATGAVACGILDVSVTLEDYSGDLSLCPIKVDCIGSDGSLAYTTTVTRSVNPAIVVSPGIAVGSYTVRASAARWLSAITTASISKNTTTTATLSLPNGDLDGDGKVTSTDLNTGLKSIDQRGGE